MKTVPLAHAAEVMLGRQRAPQYEDGEGQTPYLRSANITDGRIDVADVKSMRFSPSERATFALRRGDVLVTEGSGSRATVGASAVWQGDFPETVCFQNTLLRLRPRPGMDGRYLAWWARHAHASGLMAAASSGANIFHLGAEDLRRLPIKLPDLERQRRIADFLDDQVARLDKAVEETDSVRAAVAERPVLALAERLLDSTGAWKLRSDWKLAPVSAFFGVALGKMLNEERASGVRLRPYLRNTNVQWDRVDTSDLKQMHFQPGERRRYGLLPGDLLVCEGGQPGRAAIWDGSEQDIFYQKALHRVRPRTSDAEPRWLLHLLRLCVVRQMFTDESGTTIAHLTNEQMRSLRLPFPSAAEQRVIAQEADQLLAASASVSVVTADVASLLDERKRALITACVTGDFDVAAASTRAGDAAMAGLA